ILPSVNLATAFAASAGRNGEKSALFWSNQEYSFESLQAQTRFLAVTLQRQFGVRPGDRVALWLKNCPEFIPALFGIFHAGPVVVPINNFLKPEEIGFILADADIHVLVTDHSMAEHHPDLLALRPGLKFWQVEDFAKSENGDAVRAASAEVPGVSTDDLAV